ncbi:MAG: acetylornithine/succinylornithine family transaminase [Oscillospiraceae bacterium]|jgi:acetylornithine/N-succinyldiaminopimelate aminotransferase
MTSNMIKEIDSQSVIQTYGRFDLVIERGKGSVVYDFEGREYVDFTSGIGVNSIGYADPDWAEAVSAQAGKLAHMSNHFYTQPGTMLAQKLCRMTGMSSVFFANSGAESNEGVIKLARKYSFDKYGKGRSNIITLNRSFHGRTLAALSATGQDSFHNYFYPFPEGFRYAKPNDLDSVKSLDDGTVCAVMLEAIQGEGGVLPLDDDFVLGVKRLCGEKDWLLIFDEVQTGVGRTGTLFAFQRYGFLPDAVSFAKGIGGGLPLGGFLVNEKCKNVLTAGTHASTFGANPVCCAGALVVLDKLEKGVLEEVEAKGSYIRDKIEAMNSPYVAGTRGRGLMIGISIQNASPKDLANKLTKAGLLVLTAGNDAIRLLPPLTITYEEIDKGLSIMEKILAGEGVK